MTVQPTTLGGSDEGPWYKSLDRRQWNTLLAANLGWLFDGFENYALILTAGPAMRQLLDPSQHAQIPFYIGTVIAINLLGWGIGGMLGGIAADYIGRKRMMMLAILAYSVMTGLSAIAWDWWSFAILRFLVGIAVGSEWATGSSMMAEMWPDRARGKGAGLMQCGLGIGFFIASLVWLFIAPLGPDSWRWMYLIGVLPALVTLWIRRSIPESERWEAASSRRAAAKASRRAGARLTAGEEQLTKFTLHDLFTDRETRGRTIVVFLMSLTTTVGFWSISTWVPPFVGSTAAQSGLVAAQWASYAGMAYTAGSITGYIAFGFLADALGRKVVTMAFFAIALALTPVLFFGTTDLKLLLLFAYVNAIFSNGQYTWMPVWLPELYPTRMRATALAFAFNAPRFIAFLGPLLAGSMIVAFGGFGKAAMVLASIYILGLAVAPFLPETRGKPLPE
ncbi:MFS transporter [Rhodoplanes roseus]|uniref:MFS transporter n=1 Tax=Rhodoplanes roseus TaxID=29409 RepID=A0A327KPS6_9BRAD|nr:MFS transporter [Rhodoplanes roseus]RAI40859.1 MFS transporter [Rhodoplanes roseus]